ncbi:MAG: glycosyltransferase [Neisseriaceae bacterium]|nr:MAG: glycosyltransferase [Neisseriaceae bacterium]
MSASLKKIKVHFHVNTLLYGGLEKILITYLRNFDRHKYKVSLSIGRRMYGLETLITSIPKDVEINYLVKSKFVNFTQNKKNRHLKLSLFEKLLHNLLLKTYSKYLYKKNLYKVTQNKNVVIDFDFYSEEVNTNCPVISFLHFSLISFLRWNEDTKSKEYKRIRDKFLKHSNIVLLNHDTLNECINLFPDCKSKFSVIYNPFDLNTIQSKSNQKIDGLCGVEYIVSVSRLEESQKDITTLIRAFHELVTTYRYKGSLVLVGDGSSRAELENLVEKLNLKDNVFFVGLQDNPYKYIKNAKIFVLSSKFEGLPSVVIEALILGTPVIASDCPTGAREILRNGECGILFNVGDHVALAKIMFDLLSDQNKCNELIELGKVRANDFDINFALEKLYRLIDNNFVDRC